DTSMKIASDLDLMGPTVAKGRYYYELPWPKRSLSKSADLLQKVIEKHPENMRARLYLAQTQLKDGDAKKAKETLAPVFTGSTAYDPPEAKRVQGLAKGVQKEIDEELN
ncbi:MAG: tetratricopeptide repeat protein, partial [Myxococcaceae bacterium]